MNILDVILGPAGAEPSPGGIHGVVVGVVTNNNDPDGMGRVKVKFPWLNDTDESHWARIAAPMAGTERGFCFYPEVDDEVLVAFEHGDIRFPYVLGGLWNGQDAPPETNSDGENNVRIIKSRSGHVVKFTDKDGEEKIEIIDSSEKNSIVIDTKENTITVTSEKDIALSATKGKISLDAQDIEITSSAATKIESSADMDLKASGTNTIKGATVNIN